MPSWRANRFHEGEQTMAVANAAAYELVTVLWRRRVGNGSIECRLVRAKRPAKRLVQLLAEYSDAGELCTTVVQVADVDEEAREALRLERLILAASARPEIHELLLP
jgi:hypothetical protein